MQRKLKHPMSSPQIKFTNKIKLIIYKSRNIQYFCAVFIVQVIALGILGHFHCLKDFLLQYFWICMFTGVSTIFQENPESYFILCDSGFSFFVSLPSEITVIHSFFSLPSLNVRIGLTLTVMNIITVMQKYCPIPIILTRAPGRISKLSLHCNNTRFNPQYIPKLELPFLLLF